MALRWLLVLAALRLAVAGYASAVPVNRPPTAHHHHAEWDGLAQTTITPGQRRGELIMELPAVDLPVGGMVRQAASVGEFPIGGSIYGVRAEIVDGTGRQLPMELLHHMNVMDPSARELFLPIARRILASGGETEEIRLPWLLVGSPFQAGEHVLAYAMVHNPTSESFQGVRVRLVLSYVPAGRPWPFFSVVPWQLDVAFPVGDKSFDLPSGHSERAYEGSPAVAGKLLAIGGHMHPYGQTIELWDATTNELLWHGEPEPAPAGEASPIPMGKFYGLTRIGLRITPEHRYRVRVVYENPTGKVLPDGGMGVIGGLFIPDRDAAWPEPNTGEALYQKDLQHFMGLNQPAASPMMMPGGGGAGGAHSHVGH